MSGKVSKRIKRLMLEKVSNKEVNVRESLKEKIKVNVGKSLKENKEVNVRENLTETQRI